MTVNSITLENISAGIADQAAGRLVIFVDAGHGKLPGMKAQFAQDIKEAINEMVENSKNGELFLSTEQPTTYHKLLREKVEKNFGLIDPDSHESGYVRELEAHADDVDEALHQCEVNLENVECAKNILEDEFSEMEADYGDLKMNIEERVEERVEEEIEKEVKRRIDRELLALDISRKKVTMLKAEIEKLNNALILSEDARKQAEIAMKAEIEQLKVDDREFQRAKMLEGAW